LEMTRRYANLMTEDLQAVHEKLSLLGWGRSMKKLVSAQYILLFAFLAFAFRNADFEMNGTKIPAMLLSAVVLLAWMGLNSLLLILLNPRNTVNRSSKK
jgi:hypothetical protein